MKESTFCNIGPASNPAVIGSVEVRQAPVDWRPLLERVADIEENTVGASELLAERLGQIRDVLCRLESRPPPVFEAPRVTVEAPRVPETVVKIDQKPSQVTVYGRLSVPPMTYLLIGLLVFLQSTIAVAAVVALYLWQRG